MTAAELRALKRGPRAPCRLSCCTRSRTMTEEVGMIKKMVVGYECDLCGAGWEADETPQNRLPDTGLDSPYSSTVVAIEPQKHYCRECVEHVEKARDAAIQERRRLFHMRARSG